MSTDYKMVCYTCKATGPIYASGSISYGFRVWDHPDILEWLGDKEAVGLHEGHDLRIVSAENDLPWGEPDDEEAA